MAVGLNSLLLLEMQNAVLLLKKKKKSTQRNAFVFLCLLIFDSIYFCCDFVQCPGMLAQRTLYNANVDLIESSGEARCVF